MDEIFERIPQLENKIYIIGGPREQALEEALTLILSITDKHFLATEFYCLKSTEEEIRTKYERIAADSGFGRGSRADFRTQKNGDVDIINKKIRASYSRRFVRLVFIDSLESMHLKGKEFNRQEVLERLTSCNPVIVVSDEIAPSGSDGGQYESNGVTLSLSIK